MLKAPFPYFGGKSSVAEKIWHALENPAHYIEPFFGSGAVLLLMPDVTGRECETVNDKDGFVANVWRSIKFSPDETANWCDWPVNHADLCARKKALLKNESRLLENLITDDEWHDPKMAGYWIWAASCWIGSGLTSPGQIPHVSGAGTGVHTIGKIPHAGKQQHIYDWMTDLSARLRRVRVVCGDWTRVCGGNWQDKMGVCGMFFDPPYGVTDRVTNVYHHDSTTVAAEVMDWVRARGGNPRYRIVLAGYDEYMSLVNEHGWRCERWKAQGGYSNTQRKDGSTAIGKENAKRETLYFSPHCVDTTRQGGLF